MLHLAVKAFSPAPVPVPAAARRHRPQLPRGARLPRRDGRAARAAARGRPRPGLDRRRPAARAPRRHAQPAADRRRCSTPSPRTGSTRCSAAAGATRRRPGPRSGSSACATTFGQWDPRRQRPELWNLYNGRHAPGEHVRVFPLSNWTELDVWRYIEREGIELPELYYAHDREVFQRDGMWLAAGAVGAAREPARRSRPRRSATAPSATCPAPAPSSPTPASVADVIAEVAASRLTERGATRADDRISRGRHGGPQAGGLLLMDARDLLRLATAGSRRRRQVHPRRPPAVRHQVGARRPARRRRAGQPRPRAWPRPTSRCSPTACAPSASRASRSTSPTATSPRPQRSFVLADTPGHVQYTRNTVTGASTAELARAARRRPQRRGRADPPAPRRRRAAAGAATSSLAVNKIDLVDFDEDVFEHGRAPTFAAVATRARHRRRRTPSRCRRWSATTSSTAPPHTPWYDGPDAARAPRDGARPAPTRRTSRSGCRCSTSSARRAPRAPEHRDYRGYAGQVASGVGARRRRGRRAAVRLAHDRGRHRPRRATRSHGRRRAPVGDAPARRRHRRLPRRPARRGERPGAAAPGGHRPRLLARRRRRCARAPGCWSSTAPAPCSPWSRSIDGRLDLDALRLDPHRPAGAQRHRPGHGALRRAAAGRDVLDLAPRRRLPARRPRRRSHPRRRHGGCRGSRRAPAVTLPRRARPHRAPGARGGWRRRPSSAERARSSAPARSCTWSPRGSARSSRSWRCPVA